MREERPVRPRSCTRMPAESTVRLLLDRLDALAAALREAGVAPEQSAQLLAAAATATMHAVTLEALLEEPPELPAQAEPVAPDPLKLAA
jgi:hypothetical protein